MATDSQIVPAYQAVYGGFVMFAGALFDKTDFFDPNAFAAKLALQFVFGSQLGWMSQDRSSKSIEKPKLNQAAVDGDIGSELLDPKFEPEI